MSIRSRISDWLLKDEAIPTEQKVDTNAVLPISLSRQEPPEMDTKERLESCVSWTYAAVSVICDEIAGVEIKLYKKTNKGVDEITEHPLLDLLYKVNPFTTKFDHFWSTQQYLELTGEAPWFLEKKGTKPSSILLLRPDLLDVKFQEDGKRYYEYRTNPQKPVRLEDDEVIFLKYPDPTNPFRGRGTLQAAVRTFNLDEYSEKWNVNFFYNSARPDALLNVKQKLTKSQLEDITKQWNNKFQGLDNASKVAILHGGLSYEPISLSQKDMEYLEMQRFTRDKILATFRVPKTAVGLTEDVNRANAEATDYVFSHRTIRPKLRRIFEQLNEFLVPYYGDNLFLDFDDPTPEDIELLGAERRENVKSGLLSVNEAREELNLPEVEGGSNIFIPAGVQPGGEVREQKKKISNPEPQEKIKALNSRRSPEKRKLEKTIEATEKTITKIAKAMAKKAEKKEYTKEEKYWMGQIGITEQYEEKIIKKLKSFFNKQKEVVLSEFTEKSATIKVKKSPKQILDAKKEADRLVLLLRPDLKNLIQEEGAIAFGFIGMGGTDLDMTSTKITDFLSKHLKKSALSINATTIDRLESVIGEGIRQGEGYGDIAKRISEVFTSASDARAMAIARTEVIKANNMASVEAYRQSGVVEGKRWLTAMDERTCEECEEMNGTVIGLDDAYFDKGDSFGAQQFDFESIDEPPLHTNCRCTTTPVLIGERSMRINKKNNGRKKT